MQIIFIPYCFTGIIFAGSVIYANRIGCSTIIELIVRGEAEGNYQSYRTQCCTPPFIYLVGGVLVKITGGGVRRRGIVCNLGRLSGVPKHWRG